jgi:hypothetical protein
MPKLSKIHWLISEKKRWTRDLPVQSMVLGQTFSKPCRSDVRLCDATWSGSSYQRFGNLPWRWGQQDGMKLPWRCTRPHGVTHSYPHSHGLENMCCHLVTVKLLGGVDSGFAFGKCSVWISAETSAILIESLESCSCEKWEAGSWGRGQFGNPEEEERPSLEAATKQRLVKTE